MHLLSQLKPKLHFAFWGKIHEFYREMNIANTVNGFKTKSR